MKPIPGAPAGAPIPDFPGSKPSAPNAPKPSAPKPSAPKPVPEPAPVQMIEVAEATPWEVRVESGSSVLSIRKMDESNMWVRVDGERDGAYGTTYHTSFICELRGKPMIEAMTALKGHRPYTFRFYNRRVEYEMTENGPVFTLYGTGGHRAMKRFVVPWTLYHEIERMADELIGTP